MKMGMKDSNTSLQGGYPEQSIEYEINVKILGGLIMVVYDSSVLSFIP